MPIQYDRLKQLYRSAFAKGQKAVADEQDVERFEDEQDLTRRVLQAASDTLDLASQLEADGDPHKQRLAAIVKKSVVGAVEGREQERQRAEEARQPLEASPFVASSNPSVPNSPASTPSASLPAPAEPQRKKRGRPPKRANG